MTSIKIAQARNFNSQGELFHFQGKYTEAEEKFKDAFDFLNEAHQVHQTQEIDGCDSCYEDIAAIYHNQAKLYDDLGYYDLAEQLYRKALNISETIWKGKLEIGVSLVELHHNLARLYHFRWHEYAKAIWHYQQALDFCKKYQGTGLAEASLIRADQVLLDLDRTIDTPTYGNSQLSPYYSDAQNAYKNAAETYRTPIAQKASYAHSRLAGSLNNLGVTYYLTGKIEDARQQFEQARNIYEKRKWTSYFSYAVIANNLAKIWQKQKDRFEANNWYKIAEKIYQDNNGLYYSFYQVADFLTDYAQYFLDGKNYGKAIELLQEAIKIYRCQRPFLGHGRLLWALKSYQDNYRRSSVKCRQPGELYDEILMEYMQYEAIPNPQIANVRRSYALYLEGKNDNIKAQQQYDLALNTYNQALCAYKPALKLSDGWAIQDSGQTVKDGRVVRVLREIELTLHDYTPLFVALGSRASQEAERTYKRALETFISILGSKHWLVADVYGDYSNYLDARSVTNSVKDKARRIRASYFKRIYDLHSDDYKNEINKLYLM